MSIESEIYDRLTGFAGVSALVGTRVRPVILKQNEILPAITFRRMSTDRLKAMGARPGLTTARFDVSSWADGYLAVRNLADQVRQALDYWSATSGTVVQVSFLENEFDLYEGEPEKVWRTFQEYLVTYEE